MPRATAEHQAEDWDFAESAEVEELSYYSQSAVVVEAVGVLNSAHYCTGSVAEARDSALARIDSGRDSALARIDLIGR